MVAYKEARKAAQAQVKAAKAAFLVAKESATTPEALTEAKSAFKAAKAAAMASIPAKPTKPTKPTKPAPSN
jgi:hypothetical protein